MSRGRLRDGSASAALVAAVVVLLVLWCRPGAGAQRARALRPAQRRHGRPGPDFAHAVVRRAGQRQRQHVRPAPWPTAPEWMPGCPRSTAGRSVVRLDTAPLERGIYQLDWRILSLDDGHPSSGTLVFGVGLRPRALAVRGQRAARRALVAVRWLDLVGDPARASGRWPCPGSVLAALGAGGAPGRVGAPVRSPPRRRSPPSTRGSLTPFLRTQRPGDPPGVWLGETWRP